MSVIAPETPIELDRMRVLRLDFNALAAFEEITGHSVMDGSLNMASVRDIRAMLWAGLRHEDPGLTLEAVGSMVHPGNMAYVAEQLSAAFSVTMPEPAMDGAQGGEAAAPFDGSTPGPSDGTTSVLASVSSGS